MSFILELIVVTSVVGYLAYRVEVYKNSIDILAQMNDKLNVENEKLLSIAEESVKDVQDLLRDVPEPKKWIQTPDGAIYASDCEEGTIYIDFVNGFTWLVTGEENENEYENRFMAVGKLFETSESLIFGKENDWDF